MPDLSQLLNQVIGLTERSISSNERVIGYARTIVENQKKIWAIIQKDSNILTKIDSKLDDAPFHDTYKELQDLRKEHAGLINEFCDSIEEILRGWKDDGKEPCKVAIEATLKELRREHGEISEDSESNSSGIFVELKKIKDEIGLLKDTKEEKTNKIKFWTALFKMIGTIFTVAATLGIYELYKHFK